MFKGVPLSDWITLIVGVIGLVSALVARSQRVPPTVRQWAKAINNQQVLAKIAVAAEDVAGKKTASEKREWVIGEIQQLAVSKTGLRLPSSVAAALVENAYQVYKVTSAKQAAKTKPKRMYVP